MQPPEDDMEATIRINSGGPGAIELSKRVHAIAAALCQTSAQLQLGSGHGFQPPCRLCMEMVEQRANDGVVKPKLEVIDGSAD